jgi:hypothetical protein
MRSPESSQPLTGGTFETGPPITRANSGGRAPGSVPENSYINLALKAPPEVLEEQLWRDALAHTVGRVALEVRAAAPQEDPSSEESPGKGEPEPAEEERNTQAGEAGGEGPPREPPETGGEPEPEGPEDDEEPVGESEPTPEMIRKAEAAGIPLESVKLALAHGYKTPVETLIEARSYPPLREIFERMGFTLVSQIERSREDDIKRQQANSAYGNDPYIAQLEQGIKSRERVVELDAAIRNRPYSVRSSLRRPGVFGLQRVPLIGAPAARYTLAWQIYRAEKSRRQVVRDAYAELKPRYDELSGADELTPDEKMQLEILSDLKKRAETQYHDGFMGMVKRRLYSAKIKVHDQDIIVAKGKLGPLEVKKYQSDEIPSRRHVLAEQVLKIERQSEAFDKKLLNPEDSYNSNEFRGEIKKVRGERYPGATALHIKLRRLPPEPKG